MRNRVVVVVLALLSLTSVTAYADISPDPRPLPEPVTDSQPKSPKEAPKEAGCIPNWIASSAGVMAPVLLSAFALLFVARRRRSAAMDSSARPASIA